MRALAFLAALVASPAFAASNPINGTAGNDIIFGTRFEGGYECIDAKGGNDQVYAGAGPDMILGGPGNDILDLGNDFGTFTDFPGTSRCNGRDFNSNLGNRAYGGPGADVIHFAVSRNSDGTNSPHYVSGDGLGDGADVGSPTRGNDILVAHDTGGDWVVYSHVSQLDWSTKAKDRIKLVGSRTDWDIDKYVVTATSGGRFRLDDVWINGTRGERIWITPEEFHGTLIILRPASSSDADIRRAIRAAIGDWFL